MKLEDYSLKYWNKQNGDDVMSDLKLEVGKWYKAKNGYKVFIMVELDKSYAAAYPILAYTCSPDGIYCGSIAYRYDLDSDTYKTNSINEFNIIEEWKEPLKGEGWFNIYRTSSEGLYNNREIADIKAGKERIACVKVSWVEGQFDD